GFWFGRGLWFGRCGWRLGCCGFLRWCRLLGRGLFGGGHPGGLLAGLADHHECGAYGDGLTLGDEDLEDGAGHRRRNLGVDLVRRDLYEDLVLLNCVSDLLGPLEDGSLGDRLPELGHRNRRCHCPSPLSAGACRPPTSVSHLSLPKASGGRG